MWIARNESGELWAYTHEPVLHNVEPLAFYHRRDDRTEDRMLLRKEDFPDVTFENSPIEINNLQEINLSYFQKRKIVLTNKEN